MGKTLTFKTTTFKTVSLAAIGSIASITPALAHHPMGGVTPATFMEGLLSGFGHPIIGLDHLAFVIGVGLLAALLGHRFTLPLAFIVATVAGVGVHLASISLPAVETVIALSVLLIGALVISGARLPMLALAALFAVAGLFHGFAYGESIFGAETTPLLAYFLGFAAIQYAVAIGVGYAIQGVADLTDQAMTKIRIAGGVVAGVGLVFAANALMPF
jgi:urease accessory protein